MFLNCNVSFAQIYTNPGSGPAGVLSLPFTAEGNILFPLYDSGQGTYTSQIGDADVSIYVDGNLECSTTSENFGNPNYACDDEIDNNTGGTAPFEIDFHRNWDITNGVTTFDLVIIQSHILNVQTINYPYRLIAADVNLSGSVTTFDLVNIQKVIVGQATTFPGAESWEFINWFYYLFDGFKADLYDNPFMNTGDSFYPEYPNYLGGYEFSISPSGTVPSDLLKCYGIKMGDVNGSVNLYITPFAGSLEDRSTRVLTDLQSKKILKGEEVSLTFSEKDFSEIKAFQLGVNFDTDYLKFIAVKEGNIPSLPYEMNMFGDKKINEGILNVSWFHPKAFNDDTKGEQQLFTLKFKAEKDISDLSRLIKIDGNSSMESVFYTNDNAEKEANLSVEFNSLTSASFINHRITTSPNPFSNEITFESNTSFVGLTHIDIFDINGRLVKSFRENIEIQSNSIMINDLSGLPRGVYNYRISNSTINYSGKMIKQ